MILADWQIRSRCEGGMVVGWDPALVNPASLDVRLGDLLLIESAQSPELVPYPLGRHSQGDPYELRPKQFVLGHTIELLNIPDDLFAEFKLKSSPARDGLDHATAQWIDPGLNNSVLTLELTNNRQLWPQLLWPGMRVGQIVFGLMAERPINSYAVTGRYNGDTTVHASKG
jgi:dCTP deaminase